MDTVSLYEAKTGFSALIDKASKGSGTIVAKRGVPMAKIVPIEKGEGKRTLGVMSLPELPDSFFEPLPADELERWGV
ncbi:antitoxin [Betaproteobacteria bacterium]|nr:antitoxin [Betaproteobacteria bacterium]